MELGLAEIGTVPERYTREQFQLIRDEPTYAVIKRQAPAGDMQEIDGWSRSFYSVDEHLKAIMYLQKPLLQEPNDGYWRQAKESVLNEFRSFQRVKSLQFEDQFDEVPFESASAAGYGYSGKKGEGNNLNRAKSIANAAVRTYKEQLVDQGLQYAINQLAMNSTPDVAFTRTQLAKLPSIKVRNVYGEAFHYILIEGLSAAPLLEAFKRGDTFYFIGKDPTVHVPILLTEMNTVGDWFTILDWSAFDASVQLWEIDHAFACLESILDFPSELSEVAFKVSKESFKRRKLASPDGRLFMRTGGIPSGSYYTNIVGSIVNYTRIKFICAKLGYEIKRCRVQGDDSCTRIMSEFKPDIWAISQVGVPFGWTLKPEKCLITSRLEEVTFLGRGVLRGYNVRERLKVLRLMCFPEYEVDDPQISTARVHAIMKDAGYSDVLYDSIYGAMFRLYGEAQQVPSHLLTYFEKQDFFGCKYVKCLRFIKTIFQMKM
nr:coat protein [Partitiviridae sp.]